MHFKALLIMDKSPIERINEIKTLMERSSKFLSLSGWSGIWVGLCGMAASAIAYFMLDIQIDYYSHHTPKTLDQLLVLAGVTLILSIAGGFYFIAKKAKKEGMPFINTVSKRILIHFSIPLLVGGILSFIFIYHDFFVFVAPTTLLFYGLALFSVYQDTLSEVKFLSCMEIILGLLAFFFLGNGLLFWFIGFGVLHFVYGILMWNKYDKKLDKLDKK
ncbi:hypothetical protein AwDysgo_14160 [Bacteroidales bacterium]|nr:hypothetical protein AwDysgo_14160 [Bacteroidales bacterium]